MLLHTVQKNLSIHILGLHGQYLKTTMDYHSLTSLSDSVLLLRTLVQTVVTTKSWVRFDSQGMDELIKCVQEKSSEFTKLISV